MALTRAAASLATTLPVRPVDGAFVIEHSRSSVYPIDACLVARDSLPACTLVPHVVCIDRPLEFALAAVEPWPDARSAESFALNTSIHSRISLSIEKARGPSISLNAPVLVRLADGILVARALTHPSSWTDATGVILTSFKVLGSLLPCGTLPVTLRIGHNHALAPAAAVHDASSDGDVPALMAALGAGGSTEEADMVS